MQDRASHWVYKPDVVLELADETVHCHLAVLRARSEFFAGFHDDDDWTRKRQTLGGGLPRLTFVLDLKHMNWRSMEFVSRFLCAGDDAEMFDSLGTVFDCLPIGGGAYSLFPDYIDSSEDLLNLTLEVIVVSVRSRASLGCAQLTLSSERVACGPVESDLLLDHPEAPQFEQRLRTILRGSLLQPLRARGLVGSAHGRQHGGTHRLSHARCAPVRPLEEDFELGTNGRVE